MRTRLHRRSFLVPLALLAPLGCASVTGDRPGVPPNVRTITSIGDRPQPVVSGETGTAVAADEPEAPPDATAARRVSGRVVDADGEPVPEALVRVAIDGSASGRSVATHTDEAGRFALTNLREGSTYTVIAEYEDASGAVHSSRRRVSVPQRHIEITLADRGAVAPARVGRASARRELPEDEEVEPAPRASNHEDMPAQPDEEFPASDDRDEPTSAGAAPWRSGNRPAPRGRASAAAVGSEDDGPNPLPPAIEPRRHQAPPIEPEPAEDPAPPVFPSQAAPADPVPAAPVPAREASPTPAEPASDALIDAALSGGPGSPATAPSAPAVAAPSFPPSPGGTTAEPAPPPMPPPVAQPPEPPALEALPPATTPEPPPQQPAVPEPSGGGPPAMDLSPGIVPAQDVEPPAAEPLVPPPADLPEPRPLPDTAASTTKGPTWGEVAARSAAVPDRSARTVASQSPVIRRVSRDLAEKPRKEARPPQASVRAACEYDARHRRLADFTLPDLDGNPVRLRDLSADLVLLDFWGTWCGPCVTSVPHLVQLQEQYGPERLKVVGIAYEQGEPADRARELAAAVRELGINYPVLVGEADGAPCPLRSALHVQVYPTMVLLDRQGNVLWRDHGATPETLGRLDRIIAAQTREAPGAQLARAVRPTAR